MGTSRLLKEKLNNKKRLFGRKNLKKPFFALVISVSNGYNNSVKFERGKSPGRLTMPNGQELFIDYFYVAGDPFRRFGPTLKEFEASLSKEYAQFARTKMPATELLEIFKKEDETI